MKSFQLLIVSIFISVNLIALAFGQDVTLSWDPSPTSEVIGYKIHYKTESNDFPADMTNPGPDMTTIDVGNTLSTTLTDLSDNTVYFFTVTAYDDKQNQSPPSNTVSNTWIPSLISPVNGASNEPIPVTFQWETAPAGFSVSYNLYYGTDRDEVTSAASLLSPVTPLPPSGFPPSGTIFVIAGLLTGAILLSTHRRKRIPQVPTFIFIILLGGILAACGGGGSGDSNSTTDQGTTEKTPTEQSTLYAIDKGSSDYHQDFDLDTGTTYYWKVVATDTNDPTLKYESQVQFFTTETF